MIAGRSTRRAVAVARAGGDRAQTVRVRVGRAQRFRRCASGTRATVGTSLARVARRRKPMDNERILVAVDFGATSMRAFAKATQLAVSLHAPLDIVNVTPPVPLGTNPAPWISAPVTHGPVDTAEPAVGEGSATAAASPDTQCAAASFSASPPGGFTRTEANAEIRIRRF